MDLLISEVLAKLLVLTFALACAPISCFYITRDYVWNGMCSINFHSVFACSYRSPGNSTWAAISAVVAANIVLVLYIIVSMKEEKQLAAKTKAKTGDTAKPESKKTQ